MYYLLWKNIKKRCKEYFNIKGDNQRDRTTLNIRGKKTKKTHYRNEGKIRTTIKKTYNNQYSKLQIE